MKTHILDINIVSFDGIEIKCLVSNGPEELLLSYFPDNGQLTLTKENGLAQSVVRNKFQFEKVIRSAIKGNIKSGQTINAVFIEGFNFLSEEDFSTKYILVNRRRGTLKITTQEIGSNTCFKLYADGSYMGDTGQSGYGGFIEHQSGKQEIFSESFETGSSNLMELLAVSKGLQLLKNEDKIQVNTDSRFVIRGLVQWVHFWRHNNWQTAFGREVKFASHWQHVDRLCENKMVEFKWVKGHSGHEEQDFCHRLARESANNSKT